MASFTGFNMELDDRFIPLAVSNPPTAPTQVNPYLEHESACPGAADPVLKVAPATPPHKKKTAFCHANVGLEFFEKIYVLPRSIDAGIILSDLVFEIDIYSSYRKTTRQWTAYSDAALGPGVDLETPVPPGDIALIPQRGVLRDLTIDNIGPPKIDASLVFTFDTGNVLVPVTGERSQLFPYEPEDVLTEDMVFLTDVLQALSGKEQRRALRANPRSVLDFTILVDDLDRQKMENQLFDGQQRGVGLPRWHEATKTTSAIIVTDTIINVETTDYADYRALGLAVVWVDPFNFETLQIASFTATTITFNSPFLNAFPSGARVMPVATALLGKRVKLERYRQGLMSARIRGTVLDNSNDLSDVSAFSTYNSKVLLDDTAFMLSDPMVEAFTVRQVLFDNKTGSPKTLSDQDNSRKTSTKAFITIDRQSAWEVRQLLHALRGRQVSFYMPSFKDDFTAVANVGSGGSTVDVTDVQYSTLVQQAQPRDIIRIVKTDGTKSDPKEITGSSIPVAGTDRLSIAPATWGINADVEDIERIEYIHKVRLDTDRIRMRFTDANGNMTVGIQTKEVLE